MEAILFLHQAATAEQGRTADLLLACYGEYLSRVWGGGVRRQFSASESKRRWGRAGDSSTHERLLFPVDRCSDICRWFSFSEDQLFHRDLQSQDLLKVISPTKNLPFSLVCCLIVAGICKVSTTIVVRQGNRQFGTAMPSPYPYRTP